MAEIIPVEAVKLYQASSVNQQAHIASANAHHAGVGHAVANVQDVAHYHAAYEVSSTESAQFSHSATDGVFVFQPQTPDVDPVSEISGSLSDSLGELKTELDGTVEKIRTRSTGGENLTLDDVLKLQFEITEVGLYFDVAVKMAGKTTQTVETLLRGQ